LWRLTASTGTAFRAPTLYQLFSEYGATSLRPETSRNFELGLGYARGTLHFDVVVYRNLVNNLISFAGAGACASSYGCYSNTSQAKYSGLTFSGSQQVGSVKLHGSFDIQDPKDISTGKMLARRARQFGILGADTRVSDWTLGAEAQFSDYRYDDAANTTRLDGYALINLIASTAIKKDLTLLARINNLADKNYQFANTYTTPGRNLYLGLKWAPN
jgi:vitamin B12 transporter